jgi:hypothetical protein
MGSRGGARAADFDLDHCVGFFRPDGKNPARPRVNVNRDGESPITRRRYIRVNRKPVITFWRPKKRALTLEGCAKSASNRAFSGESHFAKWLQFLLLHLHEIDVMRHAQDCDASRLRPMQVRPSSAATRW